MPVNWDLARAPQGGMLDALKAYQLGSSMRQQQVDQQRQEEQFQRGEQQRVALGRAINPATGAIDHAAVQQAYAQGGDVEHLLEYRKSLQGEHAAHAKLIGQLAQGATDQATWTAGLNHALQSGAITQEEAQQFGEFSPQTRAAAMALGGVDDGPTPSVIRAVQGMGIDPRSDEGRQIITNNLTPPQYQEFGSDATGRQVIQTRGPGIGGGIAPSGGPAPMDVRGLVTSAGGTVTSGLRTPEHNRDVGGKPNSRHLTGDALDTVPPRGVSMAEWEGQLRQQLPGYRILNEGDHVHVQGAGTGIGGPRVISRTAPVEKVKPPSMTRVVNGQAYYKVNGQWFDNPEGKE